MQHIEANPCVRFEEGDETAAFLTELDSRVGVLSNKPGSGKSIVVLSLCCQPCPTKNELAVVSSTGFARIVSKRNFYQFQVHEVRANLIVASPSILHQWVGYLSNFQGLTYLEFNKRSTLPAWETFLQQCNSVRVLLVASDTLQRIQAYLPRVKFDRIFFDEIESLTFPRVQVSEIHSNFMWFVSATPFGFLGNNGRLLSTPFRREYPNGFAEYLRSRVDFIWLPPAAARKFVVKVSDQEVDDSLNLPEYVISDCRVALSAALRLVQGVINEGMMMNLLHGDRVREAIDVLLSRASAEFAVVPASNQLTLAEVASLWIQTKIDNLQREVDMVSVNAPLDEAEAQRQQCALQSLNHQIEELRSKKNSLLTRIQESDSCIICLGEEVEQPIGVKCCGQVFCLNCIRRWAVRTPSCPNCRAVISGNDLLVPTKKRSAGEMASAETSGGSSSAEQYFARSKLDALYKIFEFPSNDKVLLYLSSDEDARAASVKHALTQKGIAVFSLAQRGSLTSEDILNRFRERAGKACLLVNSFRHSAGFNLQFVDAIVMYQRMSDYEKQIIGRGMRPGRTAPLRVYRLLYPETA